MIDFRNCEIVNKEEVLDITYYELMTKSGNVLYFKESKNGYVKQINFDEYLDALSTKNDCYKVVGKKTKKILKRAIPILLGMLLVDLFIKYKSNDSHTKVLKK